MPHIRNDAPQSSCSTSSNGSCSSSSRRDFGCNGKTAEHGRRGAAAVTTAAAAAAAAVTTAAAAAAAAAAAPSAGCCRSSHMGQEPVSSRETGQKPSNGSERGSPLPWNASASLRMAGGLRMQGRPPAKYAILQLLLIALLLWSTQLKGTHGTMFGTVLV